MYMRGQDEHQDEVFSYISPEERIPQDHPLRAIRPLADQILKEMSPQFAKLYRKSSNAESKLSYLGHTLVENRSGMIVGTYLPQADGYAERDAALLMLWDQRRRSTKRFTLGADKGYDVADFVERLREMNVAPHVARKKSGSAIDERTVRHAGYRISQAKRYGVEKPFGWMKTVGGLRKVKLRGRDNLWWLFTFTAAAFNLGRLPKLRAAV